MSVMLFEGMNKYNTSYCDFLAKIVDTSFFNKSHIYMLNAKKITIAKIKSVILLTESKIYN